VIAQIAYVYDQKGRVTSDTRTLNGIAYTTAYRYDSSGRMDRITYPSGRTVTYTFDSAGRISGVTTTPSGGSSQTLVSSVTYHPFGGVKGFTFGNSQTYARTYDQDGRIATYTLAGTGFTVVYDAASRIDFITETSNPTNTNTYGYDALDRLTSATLPATSYGYTYDAVGNRLTRSAGANTDTYAYSGTSNRLSSITPASGPARSFTFDNNGSTTDDDVNTYTYDTRGRMVSATSSLGTTTYHVNALGQRSRKTNTSTDRVFLYDLQGHLIAEATAAGASIKEYGWLGGMPIAALDGTNRYYVHVDHLNTPRLVANSAGITVWRWNQDDPFGNNVADEDPDGNSTLYEMPFRFPGQYADKETNLNYNYFRGYDPNLGLYVRSDPVGLQGGLNTYGYVYGDPLRYIDYNGELGLTGTVVAGGFAVGIAIYVQSQTKPRKASASDDPSNPGNVIPFPGRKAKQEPEEECPPFYPGDGFCRRQQESLESRRKYMLQLDSSGLSKLTPLKIAAFNAEVEAHNKMCPANQVAKIGPTSVK
jgi:RHS repeat-associated protein